MIAMDVCGPPVHDLVAVNTWLRCIRNQSTRGIFVVFAEYLLFQAVVRRG